MGRIKNLAAARFGSFARQSLIAGDRGRFADHRYGAWHVRRAVAVDHQPRVSLRDQMRIEQPRQSLDNAGNADVPAYVAGKLVFAKPEIAESLWNQPAKVVAGDEERRAAARIFLEHRRDVRS